MGFAPQLLLSGVGVEKVTEISRLNGGKSVVEEGEELAYPVNE